MIPADTDAQTKIIEILEIVRESNSSVGAGKIADKLKEKGYEITERGVGYYLKLTDEMGLTKKRGHTGRVITPLGMRELEEGMAVHRVSLTLAKMEEKIYMTNLNLEEGKGDVVVNITYIPKEQFERAWDVVREVSSSGFLVCRRFRLEDETSDIVSVPSGKVALFTVCSMTVDGILVKYGIPVDTRFAGTLQVKDREPQEFTELISYEGVSIDPMSVFLARRATSVLRVAHHGKGVVMANIREVLCTSVDKTKQVLKLAERIGISGIVGYGSCGKPYLRAPVRTHKVALPIYAGVNVGAAMEEAGIDAETHPVNTVMDYSQLKDAHDTVG
ncbi:MAG: DUF128 domain-containing protein [Methermicoccaceae archaeon]